MIIGSGLLGASGLMGASGIIGDGLMGSEVQEDPGPPIESPAAWYRFNTGITEAGTGVSQWDDASGNGHHLLQATDSRRPSKDVDGSILFNGTSDGLVTGAWTQAQPVTVYALLKPITWADNDIFWDTTARMFIAQAGVTPNVSLYGGSGGYGLQNTNYSLGSYHEVCAVYNGASSVNHVNGSAAVTGNLAGTAGISPFSLGSAYNAGSGWSNIQVKEVLVYAAAHDAMQRQTVFDYLAGL